MYVCFLVRMGTFVTLAEVLEARGSPLDEDEVWCLLIVTTEALLDISNKSNQSYELHFLLDPNFTVACIQIECGAGYGEAFFLNLKYLACTELIIISIRVFFIKQTENINPVMATKSLELVTCLPT